MRVLTTLLFKFGLSSAILASPMMAGSHVKDNGDETLASGKKPLSYFSSEVIKRFVNSPRLQPVETTKGDEIAPLGMDGPVGKKGDDKTANDKTMSEAAAKAAEVKMVISEAVAIYDDMDLEEAGLDEKAFEYAWRGYYNLLKKGLIHNKAVLSICDFSQSSRNKRLYVIDVQHEKLLYRTYVAHGQNSGDEFASSFSNEPDSYKSSLGFYLTSTTYYGRNGLSLRIEGVDSGYNDMAGKRNIVLHGSTYVSDRYLQRFGTLGTSLGCPAMPSTMSPRVIRAVKNGSCLFIYHPTPVYLDHSTIIHG